MPKQTIQERFEAFHAANPQVYEELVRLATRVRRRGHSKYSIDPLLAVIRFQRDTAVNGDAGKPFKLNDHFTSRYARLLMEREPELAGMFETRRLRSDA